MIYEMEKTFRKKIYDFNQDIKIISPYYIISPEGDVYLFKDNSFLKYTFNGGLSAVMTKFTIHEDIKQYILIDSNAVYVNLAKAKGLNNALIENESFLYISRVDDDNKETLVRIGKVINIPDNNESFKDAILFKSKIERLYEELYWLTENELDLLFNDRYVSISTNDRKLRLFRQAIVNIKKTDKVGVYLGQPDDNDIMDLFVIVQRPKCITAHYHKAVNWDS